MGTHFVGHRVGRGGDQTTAWTDGSRPAGVPASLTVLPKPQGGRWQPDQCCRLALARLGFRHSREPNLRVGSYGTAATRQRELIRRSGQGPRPFANPDRPLPPCPPQPDSPAGCLPKLTALQIDEPLTSLL